MKRYLSILSCFLLIWSCKENSVNTADPDRTFHFDLSEILNNNTDLITQGEDPVFTSQILLITPDSTKSKIVIADQSGQIPWKDFNYLVIDTQHENDFSVIIYIDFYKKDSSGEEMIKQQGNQSTASTMDSPTFYTKIGILPGLKTRMIFPLSYLDAQHIFLPRYPRQLKGNARGERLNPEKIGKVIIRIEPFQKPDYTPTIKVADIYLTKELPERLPPLSTPVVDAFGQWSLKDWLGKTHSTDDLIRNLSEYNAKSGFPDNWSKYGGWKEKKFKATGYFRTQNDGNRWWLVDPDGYAFLSTGVDCIRPASEGVLSGQEDLFAWLPGKNDSLFNDIYYTRGDMHMIDFFKSNLIRVLGTDWRDHWEDITTGLLKRMRFNTIANWSDINYARHARIPYVLPLRGFPGTSVSLYRDFPDVFAPEYKSNAKKFASQLESFKSDPYLIGYFLRNEPNWAFGYHNLAFEMFATDQNSYSKDAFIKWIREKYMNTDSLNIAWNTNLKDFNALSTVVFDSMPSETAEKDFKAFSEQLVSSYINVVCDEVEKIDPVHLNLGMRYAWISSDLLYKAGERFDVFSINGYNFPGPPDTHEIARLSGKPVMIGEFHFGSTDRGLPATGIQGAMNQAARGDAFRYYMEQGFARPEIVGMHYFQWIDQPVFGRFDGENYNIGFLDICHHPYKELLEAAINTNERLYKVASGNSAPFNKIIDKVPQIYY